MSHSLLVLSVAVLLVVSMPTKSLLLHVMILLALLICYELLLMQLLSHHRLVTRLGLGLKTFLTVLWQEELVEVLVALAEIA